MDTSVRDHLQRTVMQVHELGDIEQAITKVDRQRHRTLAVAAAAGLVAVVVLAATLFSNPLQSTTPEPLQPPTPSPIADVNGWPTTAKNPPGVYSLDHKMCGSTGGGYCVVGFMHNGYGSGDVEIRLKVDPRSATPQASAEGESLGDGTPVVVAGHDGVYRRVSDRLEQWSVDIGGHTIVIKLRAKPGTSRTDLDEAHAIIDSIRTAPTDNVRNDLGYMLVFTLTSNDWDSG